MGRLTVQVLEGARKAITNTNASSLATNWYVAKCQVNFLVIFFSLPTGGYQRSLPTGWSLDRLLQRTTSEPSPAQTLQGSFTVICQKWANLFKHYQRLQSWANRAAINHNCTRVSHIDSKIGHLWFTRFTVQIGSNSKWYWWGSF